MLYYITQKEVVTVAKSPTPVKLPDELLELIDNDVKTRPEENRSTVIRNALRFYFTNRSNIPTVPGDQEPDPIKSRQTDRTALPWLGKPEPRAIVPPSTGAVWKPSRRL